MRPAQDTRITAVLLWATDDVAQQEGLVAAMSDEAPYLAAHPASFRLSFAPAWTGSASSLKACGEAALIFERPLLAPAAPRVATRSRSSRAWTRSF